MCEFIRAIHHLSDGCQLCLLWNSDTPCQAKREWGRLLAAGNWLGTYWQPDGVQQGAADLSVCNCMPAVDVSR